MSLRDKLATPPAPAKTRSAMDIWVDGLNDEDRAAVETALRDPSWRHTDLLKVLKEEGAPVPADTTFGRWRREHVAR